MQPANLDIEDIISDSDSHADIMLEITQKRAQMERGLTKASDDLRKQMEDVQLLKQFVKLTKTKIEEDRTQKRLKRDEQYRVDLPGQDS